MPLISVIIPVYKVEPYLRQCVDSVLAQHFEDMEIILVDDGSPDGCPRICDDYSYCHSNGDGNVSASAHDFIKAIHKKNGGLSSARNAGLDAAAGSYAMFLDSDDWWNGDVSFADMAESVKAHPEVDMFCFSAINYMPTGERITRNDASFFAEQEGIHPRDDYYRALLANGNLQESACTKIVRLDFIRAHHLYFQTGITGEDTEWMFRVLREAGKMMVINRQLFICRCLREGSITNSISSKNVEDMLAVISQSVAYCESDKANAEVKPYELSHCAYLWFITLSMFSGLEKTKQAALFGQIKKFRYLTKYSLSPKVRLARRVYRVLGLKLTAKIMGFYVSMGKKNVIKKGKQIGKQ